MGSGGAKATRAPAVRGGGAGPRPRGGSAPAHPPGDGLASRPDGTVACWWAATGDALLAAYHDEEWGRPVDGEVALFERSCLESFQAGLSWRTVLAKRPALRRAFHAFDPGRVAAMAPADVDRVLRDPAVVRHRGKVEGIVANAGTLLRMWESGTGLTDLVARAAMAVDDEGLAAPRHRRDVPTRSLAGDELCRALRSWGWRWIGPTSAHAWLEAIGVIDDHVVGCPRRRSLGTDD